MLRANIVVPAGFALVFAVLAAPNLLGGVARPVPQDGARPSGPLGPDTCGVCHAQIQAHDAIHGPVAVNACAACHEVVSADEHTFRLARAGAELCTHCHEVSTAGARSVHRPLADGSCTACHDPHGGTSRSLLRAPTQDALCAMCHDDVTHGAEHQHGPVAIGACTACHTPHASPHDGLLVAPRSELCTTCHVSMAQRLKQRFVHAPAAEDCGTCHDAHASDHAMFLRDEPQILCLSCHDKIRHTVETASKQHAAVTTDRQCVHCHDPHAGDHPRMMRSSMTELCLECHDRQIELDDGSELQNMKAVLASGQSLHGPVAQDNCAACHMIHGGENFRLLVREYPAEFYAPFAEERYALCFSCHEKDLVHDRHTTALTDFRNGDLNLHYVHVNREKKGRTCRACHETHASSNEKHIRDSVPFGRGGWELPVGFTKTDTGGSCATGCHKPLGYDREHPVAYHGAGGAVWPEPPSGSPD